MNECILCGHNGFDGEIDATDGDWFCRVCCETAPSGELPMAARGDN